MFLNYLHCLLEELALFYWDDPHHDWTRKSFFLINVTSSDVCFSYEKWHWLKRQLELFCYWKNCPHKFWAFRVAAKAQFSNHKILHLSRNRAQRVSLLLDIYVWKIPEYSKFIKPNNFLQHGRRTLTKQSCVTNINKELTWFYSA